jgi:hypothetical protein
MGNWANTQSSLVPSSTEELSDCHGVSPLTFYLSLPLGQPHPSTTLPTCYHSVVWKPSTWYPQEGHLDAWSYQCLAFLVFWSCYKPLFQTGSIVHYTVLEWSLSGSEYIEVKMSRFAVDTEEADHGYLKT